MPITNFVRAADRRTYTAMIMVDYSCGRRALPLYTKIKELEARKQNFESKVFMAPTPPEV